MIQYILTIIHKNKSKILVIMSIEKMPVRVYTYIRN